jgi:vacuolar-type H+-ATPase subunit I/STV1
MADLLQNEAEAKIQAKLAVLERWTEDLPWQRKSNGDFIVNDKRETVLEFFPTSLSAFAAWDGKKNSPYVRQTELASIHKLSRETLGKSRYHNLLVQVENAMKRVSIRAKQQRAPEVDVSSLSKLKKELEYLRLLKEKNDQEIGTYEVRIEAIAQDLRKVNAKLVETTLEARRRIAELEAKVSELTATLKKTTPLKTTGAKPDAAAAHNQADANARRVQEWIGNTPLQDIPVNQFGRASVTAILQGILNIPASARLSNKAIKEAFQALDAKLVKHGRKG